MSDTTLDPAATAQPASGTAVYSLRGTLIEACSCNVNCPCWIGEDPDLGECFAIVAYGIERGQIGEIDVSGLNLVLICHIPGNVLDGNWEIVALVDERGTQEQRDALVSAFTGKLSGPLGDLWEALIGEVKGVEFVPISHEVAGGSGTLQVPDLVETAMEPYRGPDGSVTTLQNSVFSTVPGSPAWIAKASINRVNLPQYGMSWEYEGRNAIQSDWNMEHAA
ncbi:MAG: DUF1326 domain-containing protein [Actinobacteria bacterium]|nr:MAG: DUF1326 domain-containing protein [Actinomycetota bacterium]